MNNAKFPMRLNVALFFAVASYSTLQSIIIPILPSLADRFNAPTSQAAWVVSGFLMIGAVVTPIAGRLGDLYGHVKVLLVILGIFVLGAFLAIIATSMLMLITARMLQGVGAAAVSLSFSIIKGRYPPTQAAGAVGMISATMAVASGTGLALSGLISTYLGYGMIFGLPLVVSMSSILLLLPQLRMDRPVATNRRTINWFGGLFFAVAMLFVLLAITQGNTWGWLAPATVLMFLVGLGVGALWVVVELRALNPLLDVRVLVSPNMVRINLTTLLAGTVMFSMYTLMPVFLQARTSDGLGLGLSVTTSGLLMLPIAVMNFVSGALAGRIAAAIGSRNMLVLGCVMNFLAIALVAVLHDSIMAIVAVCILHGIGVGLSFASMPTLTMLAVPPQQAGIAAGIYNTLRTVGGAIGTQVGYAILAAGGPTPTGQTFTTLVIFVGSVCAASIVSALLIPRSPSPFTP